MTSQIALAEKPFTHAQEINRHKQERKSRQKRIEAQIASSQLMQQERKELSKTGGNETQPKHYATPQVRPKRVHFAAPESAWLDRDGDKLATPFSPEKLPGATV